MSDAEELQYRRNYTHRRGGSKKRTGEDVPLFALQEHRRKINPAWAKWGYWQGDQGANLRSYEFATGPRRNVHEREKEESRLNKNYRRTENPVRKRRNYWHPEREPL